MLTAIRAWWRRVTAAPVAAAAPTPKKRGRVRSTVLDMAGGAREPLTPPGAVLPKAASAFVMPQVPRGVVPAGNATMAQDNAMTELFGWAAQSAISEGLVFPGYPYLSELTQRAEYRRPAEILAQQMTRKWIKIKAVGDDGGEKAEKITKIEAELKRINAREVFKEALEEDGYFGRAQIFIDCGSEDDEELRMPLSESATKISKGSLQRLQVIEPLWTYPDQFNSTNPLKQDFYRPSSWFVMGKRIHASRLLTIVSRPVPDMLKPVYVFGGLSLSQLAKPYVDNWLRTRQSVSDLLHSFNVNVLKTDMSATLSGDDQDDGFFTRLDLFNRVRDNRGVLALDKDSEEFQAVSAPLTSLDHLQAQSQEHMSAVTGIPLIVLLGITPTGLNASSEGELRTFYDWIESQQESHLRPHLAKILNVVQLSLFGEIDPDIGFSFVPLWSPSEPEKATTRKTNADAAAVMIDKGVLDPSEERERVAREEDSLYPGLDLTKVIEPPAPPPAPGGQPGGTDDPAEQDEADLAAMMAAGKGQQQPPSLQQ